MTSGCCGGSQLGLLSAKACEVGKGGEDLSGADPARLSFPTTEEPSHGEPAAGRNQSPTGTATHRRATHTPKVPGNFDEAVRRQTEYLNSKLSQEEAGKARKRLSLYEHKKPYRA